VEEIRDSSMSIDKDRTKAILSNWSRWSRADSPDPASVDYYTVSPMFKDITPQGSSAPYDIDSAMLVEEVMRELYKRYPADRTLLIEVYTCPVDEPIDAVADRYGVSRSTLYRRLDAARNIFAQTWDGVIA
jgi:hypothetical protein